MPCSSFFMISFCGAFVCKTPASQKNTCHFLYNNSAMEGASIVCIKTRGFSPENPSSKMARRPFLRGFPPFASAHCRICGNYGAPIPAALEYATNLNRHTSCKQALSLQTNASHANKSPACKQTPLMQRTHLKQTSTTLATNTPLATNTSKANQRTSCKQAHPMQTNTSHANSHTSCKQALSLQTNVSHANKPPACKQTPLMQRTHLTQTATPHANQRTSCKP